MEGNRQCTSPGDLMCCIGRSFFVEQVKTWQRGTWVRTKRSFTNAWKAKGRIEITSNVRFVQCPVGNSLVMM